jgi:membrane protein DedA with SNARE-associated domain
MSSIFSFFQHLGVFGLFALETLDLVLFMPFSIDVLLIGMVSGSGSYWMIPAYVVSATLGSLFGAFAVDLLMRKIGKKGLKKFIKPKTLKRRRRN